MGFMSKLLSFGSDKDLKRYYKIVDQINGLEPQFEKMTEEELRAQTDKFRERYANGESLDDMLPEAFATVREASKRTMGMRHFDVQLIGAMALHEGHIAEMKTGEGKTLVSTLAGYLNAIAGKGVHVVTVNDYLAKRDSEWMGRIYKYLGMTVGLLQNNMPLELKRPAYQADVTYGTNSEFGFDYLRDNMVTRPEQRVQRGHNYAIVDEVDSILIDEARTPLIISGAGTKSASTYKDFARAVRGLERGEDVSHDMLTATEDVEPTGDYVMDEAKHTIAATERGLKKIERRLGIDDIYADLSGQLVNHLQQALKAQYMFHRDKQYVVTNGEVKIVDEFTGRIMEGRRYSEGLHQAIEAKEGVLVREENQTLATITLQNYFRLYDKLSGMTGTALTEDAEFREIYKLPVEVIPSNKPVQRVDHEDLVYRTIQAKYNAVADDVERRHAKGQPVLVGTVSIESSEKLSAALTKRGIAHEVLNAKHHEREAHIVAQAGRYGAVTIATNMAGRGTDIMLGGNVTYMAKATLRKELTRQMNADLEVLKDEYEHAKARAKAQGLPIPPAPDTAYEAKVEMLMTECDGHADTQDADILAARKRFDELVAEYEPEVKREAEAVREAGGLFIIGTERHESRRIDNQLRGRAGRQGDPGASRFFLSLEDDLMRIFGGERVQGLMDTLGLDEDMPIENKLITNTIESAQKKLEASNFAIRKQVLQYDDVMNQQREIIYKQRQMVLDGEDISDKLHEMMKQSIDETCESFLSGETADDWDFAALRRHYLNWLCLPTDFNYTAEQLNDLKREDVAKVLYERGMSILESKEQKYGAPMMRELERICLLRNVDSKWMEHIDNMDQLKQGMSLRGYGQRDPIVEYRIEGFAMFDEMIATIREDAVHMLLTIEVRQQNQEPKREQVGKPTGEGAPAQAGAKGATPVRVTKIGRNDPCPCGSGLKWKKCTCKEYHPDL